MRIFEKLLAALLIYALSACGLAAAEIPKEEQTAQTGQGPEAIEGEPLAGGGPREGGARTPRCSASFVRNGYGRLKASRKVSLMQS